MTNTSDLQSNSSTVNTHGISITKEYTTEVVNDIIKRKTWQRGEEKASMHDSLYGSLNSPLI